MRELYSTVNRPLAWILRTQTIFSIKQISKIMLAGQRMQYQQWITTFSKPQTMLFGYYRRGWFKDHSGDIDGAIEDYTLCITMEPDYAYTYLNRGVLYHLKGDMSAAEKDFKQVIKLDSVPDEIECAQYAYYYLGNKEKAISIVNEMLKKERQGRLL